jgi:hypothetical protein
MNYQKHANASFNGDFFSIESESYWSICGYCHSEIFLDSAVSSEILGESIINALEKSRELTQEELAMLQKDLKEREKYRVSYIKKTYGYKENRDIFKTMMRCYITEDGDRVIISPTKKYSLLGSGGLESLDDVELKINNSFKEIGEALKLAFTRCIGQGAYEFHKKLKAIGWEK